MKFVEKHFYIKKNVYSGQKDVSVTHDRLE